MHNMSLKTKNLGQYSTGIFVSQIEKKGSLWNVIPENYKNRDAKNKRFKRLFELFLMGGKWGAKKQQYLTSNWSICSNKVSTHWSRYFRFLLHFSYFIYNCNMVVAAAISSKLIFPNTTAKNINQKRVALYFVWHKLLQTKSVWSN